MGRVSSNGQMGVAIQVILQRITSTGMGSMHGLMVGCSRVHGSIIGLMGRGYLHGQMGGFRKETKKMIRNMGLVNSSGRTAKNTSGIGKMVNNTGMGSCIRMTSRCVGHGRRVSC